MCSVHQANFYGWLHQKLHSPPAVVCALRNMPDPVRASEAAWLPFMRDELECKEDTIIVGHSSGAAAAMRFCESYKTAGGLRSRWAAALLPCTCRNRRCRVPELR